MTPSHAAVSREGTVEALTGAHAGWVLSREIRKTGVPTPLSEAEGHMVGRKSASARLTPRGRRHHARVETSCMGTRGVLNSFEPKTCPGDRAMSKNSRASARTYGCPVGESEGPAACAAGSPVAPRRSRPRERRHVAPEDGSPLA